MQTIKKGSYVCEKFASVYEFINTLERRQPNKVFADFELSSERVDDERWSGTRTWDESVTIFRNGYHEGMERLNRGMATMVDETPKPRTVISVVGGVCHIPNFVKGYPKDMKYRKRTRHEVPVINIYYDRGASSDVSSDELSRASHLVLVAVRHIEAHGIRVGLNVLDISCTHHQTVCPVVNIKGSHDPLNPLKVAYPLVHTSFFRRQTFRWLETSPVVTDSSFHSGYGYPFSSMVSKLDERRNRLIEHGIIGTKDVYIDQKFMSGIQTGEQLVDYIEETIHSHN